jgi:hypothetical protein
VSFGGRLDYAASMARLKLIAVGLAAGLGGVLHLWYRGVLAVPEVKRRKAARRAAKRA